MEKFTVSGSGSVLMSHFTLRLLIYSGLTRDTQEPPSLGVKATMSTVKAPHSPGLCVQLLHHPGNQQHRLTLKMF